MLGDRAEISGRGRPELSMTARRLSLLTARGGWRAGAFSLVELMIAIAILVGLTGLVLPAGMGWIARERFVEAGRQLPAALSAARADARHDGVPRRVTASVNDAGRVVIMVQRVDAAEMASEVAASDRSSAGSASVVNEQRPARLLMELPAGCSIVSSAGAAEPGAEASGEQPSEAGGKTSSTTQEGAVSGRSAERDEPNLPVEPVTVVVYLADGGAVAPAKTLLTGPGGRIAPIWFDRWTGRAHVGERVSAAPSTESQEPTDQRAETERREATPPAGDRSSGPASEEGGKGP